MINIYLELEKLKAILRTKGLDEQTIEETVRNAELEISLALRNLMDEGLDSAIKAGVEKDSEEFINDLRPRYDAFVLETESNITDFSEPPMPMLDRLLQNNPKPMKDGSGVYKIIPVGAESKQPRKKIHSNIFDAQKAIAVQRHQEAVSQYNRVIPKGSKVNFRTATSKQDRNTQWVLPAKDKDFTEDLQEINRTLRASHDDIIVSIIRSYEEGF